MTIQDLLSYYSVSSVQDLMSRLDVREKRGLFSKSYILGETSFNNLEEALGAAYVQDTTNLVMSQYGMKTDAKQSSSLRNGDNREERSQQVDRSIRMGVSAKREGNFPSAISWYEHAIGLDPVNPVAYYSLAKTCYLNGEREKSILNYMRTLHLSIYNCWRKFQQGDNTEMQFIKSHQDRASLSQFEKHHQAALFVPLQDNTLRHLAHALLDLDEPNLATRCDQVYSDAPSPEGIVMALGIHIGNYRRALKGLSSDTSDSSNFETVFYRPVGLQTALNYIVWRQMSPGADVRLLYTDDIFN